MKPGNTKKRPRQRSRLRAVGFRLAAVMLGLMPLLLIEGVLTAFDWGRPDLADDPLLGFSEVYPLFVPNEDGTRYRIAPSRTEFFCDDSFAAKKPPNEFRIFCLGGSTVQGRPYAIETSFPTWLEFNLQAADPERRWEVVNCGGVSYASYRLVPILEEVLGYQPDLIVLYTGHNEFLEDRTYEHVKHLPSVVARTGGLLARTRTCTLARMGYQRLRGTSDETAREGRPVLGPETDAMLEYRDGLKQYHRDDKWQRDVIDHFRHSLGRMVQMAREADVPILLVNPVSNLRVYPPFKSEHPDEWTNKKLRNDWTDKEFRRWTQLDEQARACMATRHDKAIELFRQALEIDGQYARTHFDLAQTYDWAGRTAEARQSYLRAKELDVCPLRMLEPMHEALFEVARRSDTPVVDVRKLFEGLNDAGIPCDHLVDHVHPSIEGHRIIADLLTGELIHQGIVDPVPDWKKGRQEQAKRHLDSLGDHYFQLGMKRLDALRLWTMGLGGKRSGEEEWGVKSGE
ncbi:MAG: tetratricopeptide repeat protein [Candidatus Nealsonbacteria bacterium]|nr:tetratricopeptide repeat protein [Candidatus Nealsonbacteria bacterium]